jgi:hypothetical protein
MIVHATSEQALGILGAMRQVGEAGGAELLRPADRAALEAAYRYVFKGSAPLDVESLPPSPPAELRALGARLRDHRGHLRAAVEFLGSGARAGGHITPALRDPASRPRRGRHPGPPGALTRGIRRHGDVRCQHHDADISTPPQLSAHRLQPPSGMARLDCSSGTTFHCFSSSSHVMASHVQAILALRSHFLDSLQNVLNR